MATEATGLQRTQPEIDSTRKCASSGKEPDYSQALWIVDGKITHIKEFREHDDALAYAEDSERSIS